LAAYLHYSPPLHVVFLFWPGGSSAAPHGLAEGLMRWLFGSFAGVFVNVKMSGPIRFAFLGFFGLI
jgi:hypothetical protein